MEHLIAGQDLCLAEHNNYLCDRLHEYTDIKDTIYSLPGSERAGELREEGNQVERLTAGQVLCLAGHYNYLCDRLHEYTDIKDTSCCYCPGRSLLVN